MKYILLQASARWPYNHVDKETIEKLNKTGFKVEGGYLQDKWGKLPTIAINIESLEDLNKLHKTVGDFIFYSDNSPLPEDVDNILMIYDDYLE